MFDIVLCVVFGSGLGFIVSVDGLIFMFVYVVDEVIDVMVWFIDCCEFKVMVLVVDL